MSTPREDVAWACDKCGAKYATFELCEVHEALCTAALQPTPRAAALTPGAQVDKESSLAVALRGAEQARWEAEAQREEAMREREAAMREGKAAKDSLKKAQVFHERSVTTTFS